VIYEEILKEKNILNHLDNFGFYQVGSNPDSTPALRLESPAFVYND